MSRHYDHKSDLAMSAVAQRVGTGGRDDAALKEAAEAIRATEIEAVRPDAGSRDLAQVTHLESLSIDDLRKLAAVLDVPDRGQIIEQDELIAAIRLRM